MDGNNFKSQMTGFATLGWSERFTSQWRDVSADIIRFRLMMALVNARVTFGKL
jgi:hypothetical protein